MAGQAPAAAVCACVLTGHRAENEAWHADMLSCVERPRGDGDRSTIAVAPGLRGRRLGFTFSSARCGESAMAARGWKIILQSSGPDSRARRVEKCRRQFRHSSLLAGFSWVGTSHEITSFYYLTRSILGGF